MKIGRGYVLTLAMALCLCDIVLPLFRKVDLAIFYIANIAIFLVLTLVFSSLKPSARKNLNILGVLFFAGIVVLVIFRLINPGQAAT